MEANKVKFLDGLEVQAELDAIQKEDQQKLAEERQKLIEEQRRLVAQRIAASAAETKSNHRQPFVIEISISRDLHFNSLQDEVINELRNAYWGVCYIRKGSFNNSVYQIRYMGPSDKHPSNS